nr:hypothetical protein GCM10020093_070360 [Planobispora longispora]
MPGVGRAVGDQIGRDHGAVVAHLVVGARRGLRRGPAVSATTAPAMTDRILAMTLSAAAIRPAVNDPLAADDLLTVDGLPTVNGPLPVDGLLTVDGLLAANDLLPADGPPTAGGLPVAPGGSLRASFRDREHAVRTGDHGEVGRRAVPAGKVIRRRPSSSLRQRRPPPGAVVRAGPQVGERPVGPELQPRRGRREGRNGWSAGRYTAAVSVSSS